MQRRRIALPCSAAHLRFAPVGALSELPRIISSPKPSILKSIENRRVLVVSGLGPTHGSLFPRAPSSSLCFPSSPPSLCFSFTDFARVSSSGRGSLKDIIRRPWC